MRCYISVVFFCIPLITYEIEQRFLYLLAFIYLVWRSDCSGCLPIFKLDCLFLLLLLLSSMSSLRIVLPYVPVSYLLSIFLQKLETFVYKDMCTYIFTAALFMMAKTGKQLKFLSWDDWIRTHGLCIEGCLESIQLYNMKNRNICWRYKIQETLYIRLMPSSPSK